MAQFWIDPSNFDGANWSYWAMQGSPRNLVVGDDGGTPALQFVGGGAFDYTAALYTPAGGSANAEVFLLMRITDQDGTGKAGGVVWADPTAGDAYYIDQNYDDSAYFFRFDGGSRSNFANAGYARGIVYFNSRFRVTQGAGGEALLKYKAWDLGAPEPAGWITEEADSVLAAAPLPHRHSDEEYALAKRRRVRIGRSARRPASPPPERMSSRCCTF